MTTWIEILKHLYSINKSELFGQFITKPGLKDSFEWSGTSAKVSKFPYLSSAW
jgi:hypothetical protein